MVRPLPPRPAHPNLLPPDGWDTGWKAAKSLSGSQPVNVLVLGDSTTHGTTALTDVMSQTWLAKLRAGLPNTPANSLLGGDCWGYQQSQDWWTAKGKGTFPGTPPIVNNITANLSRFAFPIGQGLWYTQATAGTALTFTPPYTCTDLDLICLQFANGTFKSAVDGGAQQTNTVAAASATTTPPIRFSHSGLALASHSLTMGDTSANATMMIIGWAAYRSRLAGIRFHWGGVQAAGLSAFTTTTWPNDGARLLQGYTTAAANDIGFGFPFQVDLAILAAGLNDCQGLGYGPGGYYQGMRRAILALRRGNPLCSILIMSMYLPDTVYADSSGFINGNNWHIFREVNLKLAQEFNCGHLDVNTLWGPSALAKGFVSSSVDPHPSQLGHSNIADTLLNYVL